MLCSPVAVFSQIRSAWPTAGVGFGVGLGEDEGGAAVKKTGDRYPISATQNHFMMEGRNPVRVVTAAKLYEMKSDTVRLKDKADCLALNEKFHFERS